MKRNQLILLFIVLSALSLLGAKVLFPFFSFPFNKEQYLNKVYQFHEAAKQTCGTLPEEEQAAMDDYYLKWSREWYEHFYHLLSAEEKQWIWICKTNYLQCRAKYNLQRTLKGIYIQIEDLLLDDP